MSKFYWPEDQAAHDAEANPPGSTWHIECGPEVPLGTIVIALMMLVVGIALVISFPP